MEMYNVDVDLLNKEQRPTELAYDCLEFWRYLMDTWKIDTSDEDYQRMRDEKVLSEYEYEDDRWG